MGEGHTRDHGTKRPWDHAGWIMPGTLAAWFLGPVVCVLPPGRLDRRGSVRRFVQVAVLGAVAFAFMYVDFPIPPFPPFLKYDPSDVPALIATFALGPSAGISVEVIKALLIQLLRSGTVGGPFGVFMNLLAGVTLVGVAGVYYLVDHTRAGAIKALVLGVASMTGIMILANVTLTPIFFGMPRGQVVALVVPPLVAVNVLKGILTSLVTYFVYKRVRVYLYEWVGDRTAW